MATMQLQPRRWRTIVPHALRTTGIAVLAGLAVFLLFLALSWASLESDRTATAASVRAAFAQGDLKPDDSWLFGDTEIGAHQFNDCLILYQALDDRAPRQQRAVSPLTTPVDTDYACQRLATLAAGGAAAPPRFYHQYLHAHTTLARLLVPELGVRGLRALYKLLISLVLLAGMAYAMLELTRDRRADANAIWLVLFAVFARWFGFESFGQSLGHGPADLILLCFLLFVSRASAGTPLTPRVAVVAAAVFGALTMEFEFLTGGLPLGLALVLGALPFALAPDEHLGRTIASSAAAFIAAAVTCVAAKLVLVLSMFGAAPLIDTGRQLLFRTGISRAPNRDEPVGWGTYFDHVWSGLESLAPGMHWLAFGVLLLSVAAAGWAYAALRRSAQPVERLWALALLGSNLAPLMWMVIFWQHTAEHAWFMDRILVWPIASGAALFVLALRVRRPARGAPDRPAA